MQVTRIYTGDDGQSHFEELDIPVGDIRPGVPGAMTGPIPAEMVFFRHTDGDTDDVFDFHVAPRRQFVIHLAGAVEIETGDGTVRRFGVGDVLLADDTTGQGHISRGVETPRSQIFVGLAESADIDRWR